MIFWLGMRRHGGIFDQGQRSYVRGIFTPVMSAAQLLQDNTPSMSRGRLAVHQEIPLVMRPS